MRISFVFSHSGLMRHLQRVLELAARDGHDVSVIVARQKKGLLVRSLDAIKDMPNVHIVEHVETNPPWRTLIKAVRHLVDYCIYLRPNHPSPGLIKRYHKHFYKGLFRILQVPPVRKVLVNTKLQSFLRKLEKIAPVSKPVQKLLKDMKPDVLVTSPFLFPDTEDIEYIKAANSLGIPTTSIITSWDNLSTKGTAHVPVSKLFVWNEALKKEAIALHGINSKALSVIGAPTFDHLFKWTPKLSREEFCEAAGISKGKDVILYLCSSGSIANDETQAIFNYAKALKDNPKTKDCILIARPHPLNYKIWEKVYNIPDNLLVYPGKGDLPDNEDSIDTFSHTVHYSKVVIGLNTSSFLEASILGKPSLSLPGLRGCYEPEKFGHFQHLVNGDFILTPHTMDEAADMTAEIVAGGDPRKEAREAFVRSFIRPAGIEREASSVMLEEIIKTGVERTSTLSMKNFVKLRKFDQFQPVVDMEKPNPVIVYVITGLAQFPYQESVIKAMCEAGFEVHLAVLKYSTKKIFFEGEPVAPLDNELLDKVRDLIRTYSNFSFVNVTKSEMEVPRKSEKLRFLRSYVSYVRRFPKKNFYRSRWLGYMPESMQKVCGNRFVELLLRLPFWERFLGNIDKNSPPSSSVVNRLANLNPDLLITSPGNKRTNNEVEWIKAARYLNIKTGIIVLTWDNLTTKGLMHLKPDYLFAWNDNHATEAKRIHYIPKSSIFVSGSPFFDKWLNVEQYMQDKGDFVSRLGLNPERPYIVYLGSSKNIAANEAWLVRELYEELQKSKDPQVRDVQILVRPHPGNREICNDLKDLPVVLAKDDDIGIPFSHERKSILFNTLHHSSMTISLNTSAIIDAIAIDVPCISIKTDKYYDTHINSAHFKEFMKSKAVVMANGTKGCVKQIRDHLYGADPSKLKRAEFNKKFIRSPLQDKSAGDTITHIVNELLEGRKPKEIRGAIDEENNGVVGEVSAAFGGQLNVAKNEV